MVSEPLVNIILLPHNSYVFFINGSADSDTTVRPATGIHIDNVSMVELQGAVLIVLLHLRHYLIVNRASVRHALM